MTDLEPIYSVSYWYEFHKRSRSPLFSQFILVGSGIRKLGFPFDNRVRFFGTFRDHVAVSMKEKEALAERVIAYLQGKPDFLYAFMQQAYEDHSAIVKRWQAMNAAGFGNVSNEELAEVFQGYVSDMYSFGAYVTLPLFVEEDLESFIPEPLAADPIRDGIVLEEEMARLALAAEGVTDEKLNAHAARFGWMANTGFFETYYDAEHYRSLLSDETKAREVLAAIQKEREEHRKAFDHLLEGVTDEYKKWMVRTINEAVYFRSRRTEMLYSSAYYNQILFKEVAKRLSLPSTKELVWFYAEEIIAGLRGGFLPATQAEKRKGGYVFLSDYDGRYWAWEGEEADRIFKNYEAKMASIILNTQELTGASAYAGKARGRAVVVLSVADIGKVQEGDVLITHATNVNFVPALKRVAAIVTEEGGILSHASIISRELKIPCVIGVKNATKVLKDGNMVEVDAEKGVVKILKRAG